MDDDADVVGHSVVDVRAVDSVGRSRTSPSAIATARVRDHVDASRIDSIRCDRVDAFDRSSRRRIDSKSTRVRPNARARASFARDATPGGQKRHTTPKFRNNTDYRRSIARSQEKT